LDGQKGFDSPSFAAYLLEKNGLLAEPASAVRYRLREPEVGPVAFHERGYTMFYFVDGQGQPFVIGMTPFWENCAL